MELNEEQSEKLYQQVLENLREIDRRHRREEAVLRVIHWGCLIMVIVSCLCIIYDKVLR